MSISCKCSNTFKVFEDLICYEIEKDIFLKLIESNQQFKDYFLNDLVNKIQTLKDKEYTSELLDIDVNLEKRFRDLAKCELRLRKANEINDGTGISRAQESLNKQLNLLKMNDFSINQKDERQKFIDRIAWMIEETEPAEEEDRAKYSDIAGYEKIYNSWMRSMKNILTGDTIYPDIPIEEE